MLYPKLRFSEFTETWEKRFIKQILTIGSGRDYKHLKHGEIPVFGTGGLMSKVDDFLYEGETVCIGRKGTIDKPMYFNGKIWTVDTLFYTHSFNHSNPLFVYYIFNKINWKEYNEASGVPSLSKSTIEKIIVNIPSLPEQTKIASFLSTVDEKIQHLKKQLSLQEQYKKGVMQKIFSREIRFKDENGNDFPEWEDRKVNDIFHITRGNVLSVTNMELEKKNEYCYPVFSSQTKNGGICGYYNEYLFENAITWTTDGANAGEVNYRKGKFYCTNVCGVLLSKEGYANECIAEILNSIAKKYVSYVGNPKLMNNVMANISFLVPSSIQEQQKISSFLSSIDDKIEKNKEQIRKMELWKKGLLQQMFV